MRRIVSVWLPAWPLDRLKKAAPGAVPDEHPFALVRVGTETGNGQTLHAVNVAARRLGLSAGLALADARAAVPVLATQPADLARDRRALGRLAIWAGRYGPRRNVDGDDGFWVDVTGVAHLFGGEDALLHDLAARLAGAGITARVALAETLGAAYALARHGGRSLAVVPPGQTTQALGSLRIEALRLAPETVLLLKRLGLRRIDQLYDVPRSALARRFRFDRTSRGSGRQAEAAAENLITRLDQALGRSDEPRRPLVEPPEHRAQCVFAEPLLSMEGVLSATADAVTKLVAGLAERNLGVRRLRISLFRTDGSVALAAAGTSAPTRDVTHLISLLTDRIGALDAGFGIDAVIAEAIRTEVVPEAAAALAIRLAGTARQDPRPFFDRMTARLGAERAVRILPADTHWPERAERRVALLADVHEDAAWSSAGRSVRPSFLLTMPEPISVIAEIPDGPPARFTWRRVSHRVARAEGPERIAPEWWRVLDQAEEAPFPALGRIRDYYRIESEQGGRFWVFRAGLFGREGERGDEGEPTWYLHGLFG